MKPVRDIDYFNAAVLREKVHDFYRMEKRAPAVWGLRGKLEDSINFQGSNTSLKNIFT
jgi:hypothetical protein